MIAAATLTSVLVIIFAGFQWMTGAISPPQVEDAKKRIRSAVFGLILALLSFLILKTINPDLISLRPPQVLEVLGQTWVCPSNRSVQYASRSVCDGNCGGEYGGHTCIEGGGEYQQTGTIPDNQLCSEIGEKWVEDVNACSPPPTIGFRCCALPN